jgi:hypothetical protein
VEGPRRGPLSGREAVGGILQGKVGASSNMGGQVPGHLSRQTGQVHYCTLRVCGVPGTW